jgi:hypothetical protein
VRRRNRESGFDIVGVLFVEGVGEFAERMANDHADSWPPGSGMLRNSAPNNAVNWT